MGKILDQAREVIKRMTNHPRCASQPRRLLSRYR